MRLNPDQKLAGILCPVFSIRTETDLGIGDTEGVRQLIDWCHRHGLNILQILPINETSDDNSPYNAISSLALEPTTIAISPKLIPDLSKEKFNDIATPAVLTELRTGAVKYSKVKALKRELLWEAFRSFRSRHWQKDTERSRTFRKFQHENIEWLASYALFRVLMEDYHNWPTWDEWSPDRQTPQRAWGWFMSLTPDLHEQYAERIQFCMYVQWIAFDQWTKLKEYGTAKNVFLMGDIPFGVNRYSADVWGNRTIFNLDWSGGCPPEKAFQVDPFTEKWGQNWGIPLYDWDECRHRNFDWWRIRVDNIHKVFHLFRIDHVLGFFRIYSFPWQPKQNAAFLPLTEAQAAERTGGRLPQFQTYPDDTPEHCQFNRQQGAELLAMVQAAAGDTTVVAEDLGVVPSYVPPALAELGIPGFKIPNFLREHDHSFVDGKKYPRLSLATPATHDHHPLAAVWRELWANADRGDDGARWELRRWLKFGGVENHEPPREFNDFVHETITRGVLDSNSWLAVFMITDVFGTDGRFNVPGAVAETNWSYRLEHTVKELDHTPAILHKTELFAKIVNETGRQPATR